MTMIVISFALVKFYAFAILYVLIVMQIKLVVVVVVTHTRLVKLISGNSKIDFPWICSVHLLFPSNPRYPFFPSVHFLYNFTLRTSTLISACRVPLAKCIFEVSICPWCQFLLFLDVLLQKTGQFFP